MGDHGTPSRLADPPSDPLTRTCTICGAPFVLTTRPHQRECSTTCLESALKARHERRRGLFPELLEDELGGSFEYRSPSL